MGCTQQPSKPQLSPSPQLLQTTLRSALRSAAVPLPINHSFPFCQKAQKAGHANFYLIYLSLLVAFPIEASLLLLLLLLSLSITLPHTYIQLLSLSSIRFAFARRNEIVNNSHVGGRDANCRQIA